MSLPEDFVKRGLELAEGATLFGEPIQSLTRNELIAAVAQAYSQALRVTQETMKAIDALTSL